MVIDIYCKDHFQNLHIHEEYDTIKAKNKDPIKELQFRYSDIAKQCFKGGIVVSDGIQKNRAAHFLFSKKSQPQ